MNFVKYIQLFTEIYRLHYIYFCPGVASLKYFRLMLFLLCLLISCKPSRSVSAYLYVLITKHKAFVAFLNRLSAVTADKTAYRFFLKCCLKDFFKILER